MLANICLIRVAFELRRTRVCGPYVRCVQLFFCINHAVQDLVGRTTAVFIFTSTAFPSIFTLQRFVYPI